ncbi:MAG: endonuclease [Cyclobacteriaceae bacterium]
MKNIYLSLAVLFLAFGVFAQIPSGYYNSANGLTGEPLKSALNDIIDGHTEYSYSNLWDLLKETDKDPSNASNVIGLYSRFSMDAAAEYAGGAGWNREHVWAKSRGDFGTTMGPGTDLHHLRASDVSTNSARNNRAFDEGGTTYVDGSGNYSGTTPAKQGSGWTWDPGVSVRGDVARMIMYMAVRYEGENGEPDLELTEDVLSNTDKSPVHGKLSTLLAWHAADPVSAEEITRNDKVYGYQGNRNPFIDHPEYVAEIWGGGGSGGGGGGSSCSDTEVTLTLVTDNYGSETSWSLTQGSTTLGSGSGYGANETITETFCLADGTYTFTINDSYGDGICCAYGNGSYDLSDDQGSLASGGQFSSSESKTITISTSGGGGGGGGGTPSGAVIISEYVEGSSNNKAIEIANLSSSSVSLSDYSLKKQTNGAGSWSSSPLSLSGTLAAQTTYVIVYGSAGSTLLAKADLTTTSSVMTFNGNDPIGLFENGTLVDIVGTFSGGSGNFAQNTTLQRNASVTDPSDTYSASEWTTQPQDTFDNLGLLTGGSSGGGGGTGGGSSTMPTGYCSSEGNNSNYEYISSFTFGSLTNSSGNDGGYGDYTSQNVDVAKGASYSVSLTPTFPSGAYDEYVKIFIDLNRDGDFGDAGEEVFSAGPIQATTSGNVTIPTSASDGITKMRVSMKWDAAQTSCESFSYGEVEDYAVTIGGAGARIASQNVDDLQTSPLPKISIFPNPAVSVVNVDVAVEREGAFAVKIYDLNGKVVYQANETAFRSRIRKDINVSGLERGVYVISIGEGKEKVISKLLVN